MASGSQRKRRRLAVPESRTLYQASGRLSLMRGRTEIEARW